MRFQHPRVYHWCTVFIEWDCVDLINQRNVSLNFSVNKWGAVHIQFDVKSGWVGCDVRLWQDELTRENIKMTKQRYPSYHVVKLTGVGGWVTNVTSKLTLSVTTWISTAPLRSKISCYAMYSLFWLCNVIY